jgi:hypothetical protein
MLRSQFFRESKFSFIYKFIYSFIKKTNVLFNHFNILLRGAFVGEHFLLSLSGLALNSLCSMSYSTELKSSRYFFDGGIISKCQSSLLPAYSEHSGIIVSSALLLFSSNYVYLRASSLGLGVLGSVFNNTSLFTMWQRSSFNKVYANWKRTLIVTRSQVSGSYFRRSVFRKNIFYMLNNMTYRARRRFTYKIKVGTRRWHTARKAVLKQLATKYLPSLQRANLKNRARSKSYARLLDLFRYHGKKTPIRLKGNIKRKLVGVDFDSRRKLPRRRYRRAL